MGKDPNPRGSDFNRFIPRLSMRSLDIPVVFQYTKISVSKKNYSLGGTRFEELVLRNSLGGNLL
jgi:hypothetical protein